MRQRLLFIFAAILAADIAFAQVTPGPASGTARRFVRLLSAPASCTDGAVYRNLTDHKTYQCNEAGAWVELAGSSFSGGAVTGIDLTETLGAEALTQTCAGWRLSAPVGAWSCTGDTITRAASGSDLVITNATVSANTSYKAVVVTATVTAGTVTPALGGYTGSAISTATTTTFYAPTSATTAMTLTASATFAGTITISTTSAKPLTSDLTSSAGPVVIDPATDLHVFGGMRISGASTFVGQALVDNGTAAAPSLAFTNYTNKGFYSYTAGAIGISAGGANVGYFGAGLWNLPSTSALGWADGDVSLFRDAAGVLGLRNSTTAQEFRVYKNWTDATHYEALSFNIQSDQFWIETRAVGGLGNLNRDLVLATGGSSVDVILAPGGLPTLTVLNDGGAQFYDVGGNKPTCDATARGTVWYAAGGAGVSDTFEMCGKNAANSYAWAAITTFP